MAAIVLPQPPNASVTSAAMPRLDRRQGRPFRVPGYVTASIAVSVGGFVNGFDTGSIGAVTSMEQFHGTFGELSPFMLGFTVSLIMLAGAFPAFFAGQLADRLGRLHVISVGAATFALGAALQAGAGKLAMLLVGRALCGLGEGIFLSNGVVYISEIAPSASRGLLVSVPQLGTAAGVCLGYFACFGSVRIDSTLAWRLPFIIMASLGVVLACTAQVIPQSPRWLMLNGQREKAERELERLGVSRAEAEKDILTDSAQVAPSMSFWGGFVLMFRRPYRRRTMLALFVLGMMQLSGIDGVLYYAPILFKQAGLPSQSASFLASGVSAILMLAITIPGLLLADRWSRRASMISGGLVLSVCMLLIGSLYASHSVHPYGAARWVVVVSIFAFALAYCFTWAIVGKIYACEIQPPNTRASANSVAQGLNFFTNWLVAIATPVFLANSSSGAYFLYGSLALATVIVMWTYMPETRGRSLESIQEQFHRPVLKSFTHHVRSLFSGTSSSSASTASDEQVIELQDALVMRTDASAAASSTSVPSVNRGIMSFESTAA